MASNRRGVSFSQLGKEDEDDIVEEEGESTTAEEGSLSPLSLSDWKNGERLAMFRVVVTMVDTIEICCDSLQIIVISETKLSLTAAQTRDQRNMSQ